MIITVPVMHMVQTPVDDIVNMVTMRHCLMSAARPMHMAATGMYRRTPVRVGVAHLNNVVVVVVLVRAVQVAVVNIVYVVTMTDGGMATAWAVVVIVV
ncbi:hypothetical protein MNKW57_16410 [Biformimicrobium ophioploci]|uniref:Uncharacterized protein n=1 Tax=Biformimicrobium ophioploci TaxID=3036711 RepID=A0ABQ6LZ56_9GAMM|nr:hypothetical protein MNKW57_16410 [Microbulbifer sp. NKW57]